MPKVFLSFPPSVDVCSDCKVSGLLGDIRMLSSSAVICVVFPSACCFPGLPSGPSSLSSWEEVADTNSIGLRPGWLLFTFLANSVLRNEYPLSLVLGDVGDVGLLGAFTLRWCRPGDLGEDPSSAVLRGAIVVSTVRFGVPGRWLDGPALSTSIEKRTLCSLDSRGAAALPLSSTAGGDMVSVAALRWTDEREGAGGGPASFLSAMVRYCRRPHPNAGGGYVCMYVLSCSLGVRVCRCVLYVQPTLVE